MLTAQCWLLTLKGMLQKNENSIFQWTLKDHVQYAIGIPARSDILYFSLSIIGQFDDNICCTEPLNILFQSDESAHDRPRVLLWCPRGEQGMHCLGRSVFSHT